MRTHQKLEDLSGNLQRLRERSWEFEHKFYDKIEEQEKKISKQQSNIDELGGQLSELKRMLIDLKSLVESQAHDIWVLRNPFKFNKKDEVFIKFDSFATNPDLANKKLIIVGLYVDKMGSKFYKTYQVLLNDKIYDIDEDDIECK